MALSALRQLFACTEMLPKLDPWRVKLNRFIRRLSRRRGVITPVALFRHDASAHLCLGCRRRAAFEMLCAAIIVRP